MRAVIVIIIVIFILVPQGGCSYPRGKYDSMSGLCVSDKRMVEGAQDIRMFIRPDQARKLPCFGELEGKTEKEQIYILTKYISRLENRNEENDYWQYPAETIARGGGDCEDKVFLLLSAINAAGIEGAYGIKGRYMGGGHFWIEYDDMILDPYRKNRNIMEKDRVVGYNPFFKFNADDVYVNETLTGGAK